MSYSAYFRGIFSHQGVQRYFRNASWMFFGKFCNILLSFLANIFIVRYLGPNNLGMLSYAISFVGVISFLASFGTESILSRDLVRHPEKRDELLGATFFIRILGALTSFAIIALLVLLSNNDTPTTVMVLLIGLSLLFQPFSVIAIYFQANVSSKYIAIATMIITTILSLIKITFAAFHFSVVFFALVYIVEQILYAVSYVFIYKKQHLSIKNWIVKKETVKKIAILSAPLMFSAAFSTIYSRIDQVILGHLLGSYSVGIYSAAAQISEYWYFIPIGIISAFSPALVNSRKHSFLLYKKRLRNLLLSIFALAFSAALLLSFFSKEIVLLMYGTNFLPSVPILTIYIWGGIGMSLGFVTNFVLVIENKMKLYLFINFLSMATNIALNFILIPVYGTIGAAIATLISYSLLPFSLLFITYETTLTTDTN